MQSTQQKKNWQGPFLITAVTIALLAGLVWFSNRQTEPPTPAANSAGEEIAVEEPSFDFGSISMAAGTVTHAFKLTNKSDAAVTLNKLYTSCMCTVAKLRLKSGTFGPFGMIGHGIVPRFSAALAAGETAELEVVFDPTAHGPAGIGRIERAVILERAQGSPLQFDISAQVTP